MTHTHRAILAAVAVALSAIAATGAESPEVVISEEANVELPLDGAYRKLEIELRGKLSLRTGKAGHLRYLARLPKGQPDSAEAALVVLSRDRGVLRLRHAASPPEPLELEMAVPPELAVAVRFIDTSLSIPTLASDLELTGEGADIVASALQGSTTIDLVNAGISIRGVHGPVTLSGSRINAGITACWGPVELDVRDSEVELNDLKAGLTGDIDATGLKVDGVTGAVELEGTGGTLRLARLETGATLRLRGAPQLAVVEVKGQLDIETDGAVQLQDLPGAVRLVGLGWGPPIRAANLAGSLDLSASGSPVQLEGLAAPATVRGQELALRASGIKASLTLETTGSTIEIDGIDGELKVQNDFGDVLIRAASKAVHVTNRDGEVHALDLSGPVTIDADAVLVEVSWLSLSTAEDSRIENTRGDVNIVLADSVRCQIVAETPFGHVESDIPDVEINEDGTQAVGSIGRVTRPVVRIKSGGGVRLMRQAPPDAEPQ